MGFIATTGRAATRAIVEDGLLALRRLTHRGAQASLGSVDGCGVMTAIPWRLLDRSAEASRSAGVSGSAGCRALGMFFVRGGDRPAAEDIIERDLRVAGAAAVVWRDVPTDAAAVLPAQRGTAPAVLQAIAAFSEDESVVARALYRARLRIERTAADLGLSLDVVSLSTRTVVHKALVAPDALDVFYPDLSSDAFESTFITFHQRFSTNTSANWALAQPFRTLAHNGEINTIVGNRTWMRARFLDRTSITGFEGERPVSAQGSDSRSLDDAVGLLQYRGSSIAHALSRLVPPAWERDESLTPEVRAFHQFQSLVSEPWDGPSALVFADGRFVGAALDRNGFRPARVVKTADGVVALASEVGVLSERHEIVDRGRLGPGGMLIVDLERGRVLQTAQIRRALARPRPYAKLVSSVVQWLPTDARRGEQARPLHTAVSQQLFGISREEIELLLKPMAVDGHEAVGSMGDDTPPAVLSSRPRLFTDYFRQRFAQVTNPPIDPYRESAVMSLTSVLGAHGDYVDELSPRPRRVVLGSPVLDSAEIRALMTMPGLSSRSIDTTIEAASAGSGDAIEGCLDRIVLSACDAVQSGCAILVFSDRGAGRERAPLPALLVVSAVHHALIARGLRLRASIVADTGDVRDAHQLAALCAFGASAVCPWLAFETVAAPESCDHASDDGAPGRYRRALERGLLTVMSKMGVCTFSGYCGSSLFEVIGLHASVVDRCFHGTPSPIGGAGFAEIAAAIAERHRRACASGGGLDYPGLHGYRRDGEYHANNPVVVRGLQRARGDGREGQDGPEQQDKYAQFTSHVYGRPPSAIRDFLEFDRPSSIPLEQVEDDGTILRRFFASAMSVGALSPEAHRTIAMAMNRIGARSNSGEGGEESERFGCEGTGSRTRQVASARFGVTPAYLRSADELQIKIAQGSKPGEGGQLPAIKVVAHIARLRHAQPGTTLISPPVHHDIYSIEDLAELIVDLRAFHPSARINVKLVASTGVGIIAIGVAKAGAGAIQISGHDGGTGASPRGSIKHAGMPWEIGLSEAHRALTGAGLRSRVVLQTDGGLKTGRDVAIAAALGADEYGFGTAALVALGCVMARQCHANTCPVGIATQRADLRAGFSGTPDMLVGYLRLIARELRGILASLGLASVADLVGRADLLRAKDRAPVDLRAVIEGAGQAGGPGGAGKNRRALPGPPALPGLPAMQIAISGAIGNTDRAFGAPIAGAIANEHGEAGLPEGSVHVSVAGSAGQSFGAFSLPGMRLVLTGDANDGVGKGMRGGDIIVAPKARERGRPRQVLIGNAALYGATGGRLFVAGAAGERFAVRNSGAIASVEGVGDHGCEYMTGGTVLVLGPIGRNFAAGMTGGVAFVRESRDIAAARVCSEDAAVEALTPTDHAIVRDLLEQHARLTGSRVARALLRTDPMLTSFCRVVPVSRAAGVESEPAAAAV